MKTLLASTLAATLALSSAAFAGGAVIDDQIEIVPEKAGSSMGILPIIIVGIVLCAVLCGNDDEEGEPDPQ